MVRHIALSVVFTFSAAGLPAQGTPLFVAHVDFDAWRAGYPQSRLAQMLADPAVQPAWRSIVQMIEGTAEGLDIDALLPLLTGQAVVAVMDPGGAASPTASVGFLQAGGTQALRAWIQGTAPLMPPESVLDQGNTLVFGEDAALRQMIAGRLPQGPAAFSLEPASDAFLALRVNLGAILADIAESSALAGRPSPAAQLGFGNAHALAASIAFDGPGMRSQGRLDFNGPRTGIPSFLGPDAPFAFLDLAPQTTRSFAGLHITPPAQIAAWIDQTFGPQVLQGPAQAVQNVLQLDLREQLLPAIGGEIAYVSTAEPGPLGAGMALILAANDPATLERFASAAALMAASSLQAPFATPGQPAQTAPPQITPVTQGSVTYSTVPIMGQSVCFGTVRGHFVLASSQTLMNSIIATGDGGANVRQSEAWQAMSAGLAESGAMIRLTDMRPDPSSGAMLAQMLPMMAMGAPPEAQPLFAALPAVLQHLGQSASVVTAAPESIAFEGHSNSAIEVGAMPAVLAAIAVPNFLEARGRARVSRVRADLRSLATALEAYHIDNSSYPVWTMGNAPDSIAPDNALLATMPVFGTRAPSSLTTPIAYVAHQFEDPFNRAGGPFSYYTDGPGWILLSPGPDGDFNVNPQRDYSSAVAQPSAELLQRAYDPTNGTVSAGDVFRVRQ